MTDENQVAEETQAEPTEALNQVEPAAPSADADKPKSDPLIGQITKLRDKVRKKDVIIKELRDFAPIGGLEK